MIEKKTRRSAGLFDGYIVRKNFKKQNFSFSLCPIPFPDGISDPSAPAENVPESFFYQEDHGHIHIIFRIRNPA